MSRDVVNKHINQVILKERSIHGEFSIAKEKHAVFIDTVK